MLHSQYKQIFALFSLARCCWPDKSVNAGRKREGGEREREKKGGCRQREKLREAGFCGWLIGRVERIKFFAEQPWQKE